MDKISTYAILGIPEGFATALVLIWLSLSLAPWFGGLEIGPLKIPRLGVSINRWLRIIAPMGLLIFAFFFLRLWPVDSQNVAKITYEDYLVSFFDHSKKERLKGSLFVLNELEVREFKKLFGTSNWDGGPHWGTVSFDKSGRKATYTNEPGRSPGYILIQGPHPGTVPILIGEWHQEDEQKGKLSLTYEDSGLSRIMVRWGPGFSLSSEWKRLP